jgi:hypothetical protein
MRRNPGLRISRLDDREAEIPPPTITQREHTMGRRIRRNSIQGRALERQVQAFFADPAHGRVNPDTGILEVAGPETFRELADHLSGRTERSPIMQLLLEEDPEAEHPHMLDRMGDE